VNHAAVLGVFGSLLVSLAGCGPRVTESVVDGLRVREAEVSSGATGFFDVRFKAYDDENAIQTLIEVDGAYEAHLNELSGPQGLEIQASKLWDDDKVSVTNGVYPDSPSALNWPITADDHPFEAGTWRVEGAVVTGTTYQKRVPAHLTVVSKNDPDFSQGEIVVDLIFTEGLDEEPLVVDAFERAIERWATLYGALGVEIRVKTRAVDVGPTKAPGFGDAELFATLSEGAALDEIHVVVTPEIEAALEVYGVAGGIPGPLLPSARSAVLISSTAAAGPDGIFAPEEVRILGETLAHEVGHYLGLFHPVEMDDWDRHDNLGDTDDCGDETSCVDALGDNLMFPYPVCGVAKCAPQDQITSDQSGVVHRAVLVK
jgi:hypothetical protein